MSGSDRWSRVFAIDPRSLAVARIGVAVLVCLDALGRLRHAPALMGDGGVYPRAVLHDLNAYVWPFSASLLSGEAWWQITLVAGALLAGLALLLGWRTRLASVVCWFLVVSIQVRTPHIAYGFDDELRGLLFWGMLVPWGCRFSLDAARGRVGGGAGRAPVGGPGAAGLVVYVALMYAVTGLVKVGPAWQDLTAVHLALSLDQLRGWLGPLLLDLPALTRAMTFIVPRLEVIAAVLLVLPFGLPRLRVAGVLALACLSLGLALTMRLGLFPYMNLVALLPFVPAAAWSRAGWLERGLTGAFGRLAAGRGSPRPVAPGPGPEPRDRPSHGEAGGAGREPAPAASRLPGPLRAFAWAALILTVVWNVALVARLPAQPPPAIAWPALTLQLNPQWHMFAPSPRFDNTWMIAAGEDATGERIDVLRGGRPVDPGTVTPRAGAIRPPEPRFARPADFRWLRFRERLVFIYPRANRVYARWLCRTWNASHPERPVVSIEIILAGEDIVPWQPSRPRSPRVLATEPCGAGSAARDGAPGQPASTARDRAAG